MEKKEDAPAVLSTLLLLKLQETIDSMEKSNVAEYVEFLKNPKRLMFMNFLGGITRGFGIAVGATLAGAVFLSILARIARLNLPLIGNYVADIMEIVRRRVY